MKQLLGLIIVALAVLAPPGALAAEGKAGDKGKAPAEPAGDSPHGAYVEDCSLCHRADAWKPARPSKAFDHGKFGFKLEGVHAQASCRGCHVSLDFTKTKPKMDCVACHQDVHQDEFGTDCARCHTPRSFIDEVRMRHAHSTTRFPLSGSHLMLDCQQCHPPVVQGHMQYVNTPAECVDCHLANYQGTTNPDHQAAGFPRDCIQCHNTIAFQPARFPNHDKLYFPISSGTHKGKWTTCSDCHTTNNYAQFECILCHAHDDPVQLQSNHNGVSGYQYNSQACYTCHPTGVAGN